MNVRWQRGVFTCFGRRGRVDELTTAFSRVVKESRGASRLCQFPARGLVSPQAVIGNVDISDDGNDEGELDARLVGQQSKQRRNHGAANVSDGEHPRAFAGEWPQLRYAE